MVLGDLITALQAIQTAQGSSLECFVIDATGQQNSSFTLAVKVSGATLLTPEGNYEDQRIGNAITSTYLVIAN